jgi:hypothetical protein
MEEVDILSGQHYQALLEGETGKAKQQLEFDVPDDVSEDDDYSSSYNDNEETEGNISWSRCFHEPFLEDALITRQARISDKAREQTVRAMAMMDSKVGELLGVDEVANQSNVHQAVEEVMAEMLK